MSDPKQDKRIGLVDDDLDNFHANVYLSEIRGGLAARGFTIEGAWSMRPQEGAAWCASHDVHFCATLEELNDRVGQFLILAPSSPQTHLPLCNKVFPFQKTTFVDKTFAPDLVTAERIFELADRCQVAVQSTSALRTCEVQPAASELPEPLDHMFITAGGSTWDEYGIHPVEMAISCLGPGLTGVARRGMATHPVIDLQFTQGRTATIDFHPQAFVPFSATLCTRSHIRHVQVDDESLFRNAAAAILDFFEAGEAMIDRAETLAVRRVLDSVNADA